jgi:hypothetical protein
MLRLAFALGPAGVHRGQLVPDHCDCLSVVHSQCADSCDWPDVRPGREDVLHTM